MGFFLDDLGRPARWRGERICPMLCPQQLDERVDQEGLTSAGMPLEKKHIVGLAIEKIAEVNDYLGLSWCQIKITKKMEQVFG